MAVKRILLIGTCLIALSLSLSGCAALSIGALIMSCFARNGCLS